MTEEDYYARAMLACDGCHRLPYQGVMEGTAADVEPNAVVRTEGGDIALCPKCKKEYEEDRACKSESTSASGTSPSSPTATTSG